MEEMKNGFFFLYSWLSTGACQTNLAIWKKKFLEIWQIRGNFFFSPIKISFE
jgi:hypothetical protein